MRSLQGHLGLVFAVVALFAVPTFGGIASTVVGYWAFENPTTDNVGTDYSGNGYHLNVRNEAHYATDTTRGDVLELDGVDDYLDYPGIEIPDTFPIGDESYTIAAWIKLDGSLTQDNLYVITEWGHVQTTREMNAFCLKGTNGVANIWYGGDLSKGLPGGTFLLTPGDPSWHHVAVTYDSATSTRKLYVNGDEVASDTPLDANILQQHFKIGKSLMPFGTWHLFDGRLDDVVICDTALTETQIEETMAGGGVIPEPATVVILLTGAFGLALRRNRR